MSSDDINNSDGSNDSEAESMNSPNSTKAESIASNESQMAVFSTDQLMQEMSSLSIPNQYDEILKQIELGIQNSERVIAENLMRTSRLMSDAKNTLNAAKLEHFTPAALDSNEPHNESMQSAFQSVVNSQQQIADNLAKANEHLAQVEMESVSTSNSIMSNAQSMMSVNNNILDAENNITKSVHNMNAVIDGQLQQQHQEISKKQQVLQGILSQTQPQPEANSVSADPTNNTAG